MSDGGHTCHQHGGVLYLAYGAKRKMEAEQQSDADTCEQDLVYVILLCRSLPLLQSPLLIHIVSHGNFAHQTDTEQPYPRYSYQNLPQTLSADHESSADLALKRLL